MQEDYIDDKPMPMLPSWLTCEFHWLGIAPIVLAIIWVVNAVQSLLSFVEVNYERAD